MDSKEQAIVRTLLYSSLFSFPLTRDELYRYLISKESISPKVFDKTLKNSLGQIVTHEGYYTLKDYQDVISKRKEEEVIFTKKMESAQKVARVLSFIPTIYFLGLSGALAAGSAKKEDDIDFFIITKKNTLFSTRLLSLVILQILGKRRTVNSKKTTDKICLNMWADTTRLSFPPSEQDIYVAREIAQVKPLVVRGATYLDFLKKNSWVRKFLPHAFLSSFPPLIRKNKNILLENIFWLCEPVARTLQLLFIRRHRTNERVEKNFLAFHPTDYRNRILKAFSQAIAKRAKIL